MVEKNGYATVRVDFLTRQRGFKKAMPECFKASFGSKVTVIIDCV